MYLTLGKLKEMFDSLPKDQILKHGISEPFSWRGSYNEVAFSIEQGVSVEDCQKRIEHALSGIFTGWKGGEFVYNSDTPVNFECDEGSYSGGLYADQVLSDLITEEPAVEYRLAVALVS